MAAGLFCVYIEYFVLGESEEAEAEIEHLEGLPSERSVENRGRVTEDRDPDDDRQNETAFAGNRQTGIDLATNREDPAEAR